MICIDDTPVTARGDDLGEIWWQGRQWAVTSYGIECRDGTYAIESSRLTEVCCDDPVSPFWPVHMATKEWIDLDDFLTCFLVGLALHGHASAFKSENIRSVCKKVLYRAERDRKISAVIDRKYPLKPGQIGRIWNAAELAAACTEAAQEIDEAEERPDTFIEDFLS